MKKKVILLTALASSLQPLLYATIVMIPATGLEIIEAPVVPVRFNAVETLGGLILTAGGFAGLVGLIKFLNPEQDQEKKSDGLVTMATAAVAVAVGALICQNSR